MDTFSTCIVKPDYLSDLDFSSGVHSSSSQSSSDQAPLSEQPSDGKYPAPVNFLFFEKAKELMNCGRITSDFLCGNYTTLSLKESVLDIFPELNPIRDDIELYVKQDCIHLNSPVVVKPGETVGIIPNLTECERHNLCQHSHESGVVKFLFFGKAGELMTRTELIAVFPCGTYSSFALRLKIVLSFEQLEPINHMLIFSVNEEYVTDKVAIDIKSGDTIAVIPPLSGG